MITNSWKEVLGLLTDEMKDIYFMEDYVKLYETELDKTECFVHQEEEKLYIFPYLKRENKIFGHSFFDFETQYGYSGPVSNTKDRDFINRAQDKFFSYCKNHNYLCGFVRFNPLLGNEYYLETIADQIIDDRKTVVINTSLTADDIWSSEIHSKHRNVIRKAQKNNLEFIIDKELKYYDDFIRLYSQTLEKLEADEYYSFSQNYFQKLLKLKNVFLGVVMHQDRVIAASTFMYHGDKGHYHLSGSDKAYLGLYANNFLLYNAALYLKKMGVKHFHLGGGATSSDEDSLFKFKKRFSKSTYQYRIGKLVFNKPLYKEIEEKWVKANPEKVERYKHFLLKYRY
jgi:lipid II:glycine glycyltransferase (peptidoglycan interpeptide bridge formation enzyme)